MNYATRLDMIVTHAWETWTRNGLGLDFEARAETQKTVNDAAHNTYRDGIDDAAWLRLTLMRLG